MIRQIEKKEVKKVFRSLSSTMNPAQEEEKGGFFSGLRNSLIPPECSWGPLLKYASGSSPSFIECRDAGGEGRCIELRKHTETMGGGKRWKCHQSGTYCGSNSGGG